MKYKKTEKTKIFILTHRNTKLASSGDEANFVNDSVCECKIFFYLVVHRFLPKFQIRNWNNRFRKTQNQNNIS